MVVGTFSGLVHLVWSVVVALGLGDVYLSFILTLHSLNNPYIVESFNLGRSIVLVVVASIVGYIVGAVFATIFNKLHK